MLSSQARKKQNGGARETKRRRAVEQKSSDVKLTIPNGKYEVFAVVVLVPRATQNLVVSRCCFAEDGKEITKIYNACAQLMFCSLIISFVGVLVAVFVITLFCLYVKAVANEDTLLRKHCCS